MEIETYASSGKTAPSTAKAKKNLEGTIRINGHDARVLFNTGPIGEDILSAAFITPHGVETKVLEGELRILMAIVFVTGRSGAGFYFVTPPLLRPGVNSLPFLPAPYDTGPWPGYAVGRVFYFPR